MEAIPSCQRLKPARFHPSSRPVQKRTAKTTSPTGQLIHKPKSKTTIHVYVNYIYIAGATRDCQATSVEFEAVTSSGSAPGGVPAFRMDFRQAVAEPVGNIGRFCC